MHMRCFDRWAPANQGLELTASSIRCAPASGSSSGPALDAMSGKVEFAKSRFHMALDRAIRRHLGPDWTRLRSRRESWTALYRVTTPEERRTLESRLFDKQHDVCVTLGISRDPTVQRPTVWWDDRKKHRTVLAFANALWVNDRKYGLERRYRVPKSVVAPDLDEVIDEMVREVRERVDRWY